MRRLRPEHLDAEKLDLVISFEEAVQKPDARKGLGPAKLASFGHRSWMILVCLETPWIFHAGCIQLSSGSGQKRRKHSSAGSQTSCRARDKSLQCLCLFAPLETLFLDNVRGFNFR